MPKNVPKSAKEADVLTLSVHKRASADEMPRQNL
jgi:hypothetical protein